MAKTKTETTVAAKATVESGPTKTEIRTLGNQVAGAAVARFYTSGSSLPFKSASQRLSPVSTTNGKKPSQRQAAAIAACLVYAAGNVSKTGIFKRDGFAVPANLVNKKAKPSETVPAQLESGVLGNMLGQAVTARDNGSYQFNWDIIETQYFTLLDSGVRGDAIAAMKAVRAA